MKKAVLIVFMLLLILFSTLTVFAQGNIIECPNVKIVIDGNIGKYDNVPITIDGRTLLPLRAILTNLGVQNDNEHILWNGLDSSVTVKKDATVIFLKVGSNDATVNGETLKLDVSPVNYKGSVYIPARFIAQSLGKKVIWDGSTTTVLIRDENDFNNIKSILDKSTAAGNSITKLKFLFDGKVSSKVNGKDIDAVMTGSGEFDKTNKAMHMLMSMSSGSLPQKMDLEYYFTASSIAFKLSSANQWTKLPAPKEQTDKIFENNYNSQIKTTDSLCAGLVLQDSKNTNEIVLRGDVYLEDLLKSMDTSGNTSSLKGLQFENYSLEITIDKTTNLVTKESVNVTMDLTPSDVTAKVTENINMTFDYDSNIQITVPKEAQ